MVASSSASSSSGDKNILILLRWMGDNAGREARVILPLTAHVMELRQAVYGLVSAEGCQKLKMVFRGKLLLNDHSLLLDLLPSTQSEPSMLVHLITGRLSNRISLRVNVIWGNEVRVSVNSHDSIARVKEILHEQENISFRNQIIIFRGKHVGNEEKLQSLGVQEGDLLHIVDRANRNQRISNVIDAIQA